MYKVLKNISNKKIKYIFFVYLLKLNYEDKHFEHCFEIFILCLYVILIISSLILGCMNTL